VRIAVLSRNFAVTGGGAERYSIAIVEQLAAKHEVHVYAQTIDHDFPGVVYHSIPMPFAKPRWINQLYFAWKTWRATRIGFDIVHSHENTWHGNVHTVHVLPVKHTLFVGKTGFSLAMRWLKVVTSPRLLAYLWLEKTRFSTGTKRAIVATSNSLKKVLLASYPHAQSAIKVIAPGVLDVPGMCDPVQRNAARDRLGLPREGHGLLFVGNDFRRKGLPALLDAVAKMPDESWLAVVGQSAQIPEMQQRSQKLGIDNRVHFLGALTHVEAAYQASDCLVHPTLEDSYAMVVLEAMSHGLPVVVSGARFCGITDEITHNVQAIVLEDPTSIDELLVAVSRVFSDTVFANVLSKNAVEFARQRSWMLAANEYDLSYTQLVPTYKQRWLVLSHAFNMDGRAASQTITDKLPHLEAAGIELVVLSGVSGRHDKRYEHYQLWPAGAAGIRFEMRHVLQNRLGKGIFYRLVMVALSLPLLPFMMVEKLLHPVESSWSWWLNAYCKGRWLARHRQFDLIYSTGGAFAAHVAGMHLKRALKTPWMAEVHDPLVMPGREGASNLSPQELAQAEVERHICTEADVAIWFTDQALASALRRNRQLGERGKMMIPGVDKPATVLQPYQSGRNFVLGHFGSLSATRNLSTIVRAMEIWVKKRPEFENLVQLHLYGGPLDPVSAHAIASSTMRANVRHFGRIENDSISGQSGRDQILQRMRSADVLLLLHGDEPICEEYIPSKLYEYLWTQRPILALVNHNNQMEKLIRSQGHIAIRSDHLKAGKTVEIELAEALENMVDIWHTNGLADNVKASIYTTRAAVGRLTAWAHELSKGRS
jgi:glycosyltransferase involved in cell wall biosynthesis